MSPNWNALLMCTFAQIKRFYIMSKTKKDKNSMRISNSMKSKKRATTAIEIAIIRIVILRLNRQDYTNYHQSRHQNKVIVVTRVR